jgi:alkylhydroperoxidase family enzyme
MDEMYLKQVEGHKADGPFGELIEQGRAACSPIPQIWHLFAFKPKMAEHLARFTQEVMRGPSPLPAGIRELIAAFTSRRNECPF